MALNTSGEHCFSAAMLSYVKLRTEGLIELINHQFRDGVLDAEKNAFPKYRQIINKFDHVMFCFALSSSANVVFQLLLLIQSSVTCC